MSGSRPVPTVVLASTLAAALCWCAVPPAHAQSPTASPSLAAPPLVAPPLVARGLLVPVRETVLSVQIPGRIDALNVTDGQRVTEGDQIAALDCRAHELRRDRHAAEIRLAQKTLAVQRQLAGLNSGSALDGATAQARLDTARVDAALAEDTIRHCILSAPYDARIEEVKVNAHQYVAEGQDIVSLYDDSALEVEIIVPSRWLTWLAPDAPFQMDVDETGRTYPGRITRLGSRIDPAGQSLKVVGTLTPDATADAALLPGMSGQVRFPGP